MDLIYIANDPLHVEAADAAGVDRVMVDLEINGKRERQGHLDTVISNHTLEDVRFVRGKLRKSLLLVRANPIYEGTSEEIDAIISAGADIVMLPMFKTAGEVQAFVSFLRGRAKACILLETTEALARAEQILSVPGIDEVHVGLNDLHLALGLDFMFEVLAGGLLDHVFTICKTKGLKYGFGGIARLGRGLLPAEEILMEHARLGSSQVILSRDFHVLFDGRPPEDIKRNFAEAIALIRARYEQARNAPDFELAENQLRVRGKIAEIAAFKRKNRQ
jgi:hypothetical protein